MDDIPLLGDEQEEAIDNAQAEASVMLYGAALWVDSFFDDPRSVAEFNQTRATVKLGVGYSRNDSLEIKPRFDLRLNLPGLSHRANLFFEAAENDGMSMDNSNPLASRVEHQDTDKAPFSAALRYFLEEGEKHNFSIDTGVLWKYLFAGLRFRANQDFGGWGGQFTNRLRYYTDDGWENIASYDLDKQLGDRWLFRATSSANLLEGVAGVPFAQQFRLYQVLGSQQAISYESGVYFTTTPSCKMTDAQLVVKYRQRLFRDWLVLEISPRLNFPEEHRRQANPGILVNVEVAIGYEYTHEGN